MKTTKAPFLALLLIIPASPAAAASPKDVPGRNKTLTIPTQRRILPPAVVPTAAPPLATQPALAVRRIAEIRQSFEGQLANMEQVLGQKDPVLEPVASAGGKLFDQIAEQAASGSLNLGVSLDLGAGARAADASQGIPKVGIFPVSADPFHWGHLLIGLKAVAALNLDQVVFIPAGDDSRKPQMTKASVRHPMARAVLEPFFPLFAYSPIALGTELDGESNIFRLLALNADKPVHAFYLVGGDHYRLLDKRGNDDTIPKLEKKMAAGDLGSFHQLSVAFIDREDGGASSEVIPTSLDVHFLPNVSFTASSSAIRAGLLALMPFTAYDFIRRLSPGLYGIGP